MSLSSITCTHAGSVVISGVAPFSTQAVLSGEVVMKRNDLDQRACFREEEENAPVNNAQNILVSEAVEAEFRFWTVVASAQ